MLDQENEEYLLQTVIEGYKTFFDKHVCPYCNFF